IRTTQKEADQCIWLGTEADHSSLEEDRLKSLNVDHAGLEASSMARRSTSL
ncbi:hypothetical protein Csa_008347, partial [Cucumis sativus]